MVILDNLTARDLDTYRSLLMAAGHYDRSCGFLCGSAEIAGWNPLEVCHLVHTTQNYYGKLRDFLAHYAREDEKNFILLSLDNLYHELCHRYIHSDRETNAVDFPLPATRCFYPAKHPLPPNWRFSCYQAGFIVPPFRGGQRGSRPVHGPRKPCAGGFLIVTSIDCFAGVKVPFGQLGRQRNTKPNGSNNIPILRGIRADSNLVIIQS